MRTIALVLLVAGCGGEDVHPPATFTIPTFDFATSAPSDMARANHADASVPARIVDMAIGDDMIAPPVSPAADMARSPPSPDMTTIDMVTPCGKFSQQCCVNGGPPNPNICDPVPQNLGYGVNCRASDNLCVYCGSNGQICCTGDTCPFGVTGQHLSCVLRPGDTQKTCN